jgi:hypothetical protein
VARKQRSLFSTEKPPLAFLPSPSFFIQNLLFFSFLFFILLIYMLLSLPPSPSKTTIAALPSPEFSLPDHRWLSLIFVSGDLLKRPESFSVQFPIFFPGYSNGINRVNYNWLVSYFPSSKDSLTCVSNERWENLPLL